ncbi:hypothetical protein [Pseudomonas sp. TTU2014-080ASC]|uniref:hypothetical protein n=1 Tax=Pseudomonas sp. TTU2014-080ASC TaxID=1729724 RepID=UPI000718609B|nr:hypothetical protein [Pseudomonas sp. TTU2014-080ASC]KRW62631.1 hypothetical protein AO726_04225 [Pseudomonas sp. TTU2014-080ASC]
MNDPLQRAASSPIPVVGEGCLQRYDPDAMTAETGCDFAGAEDLWEQLESAVDKPDTAQDNSQS